jgi:AAHS family 4-hydroxybenzoate transporter-like MFS transporter
MATTSAQAAGGPVIDLAELIDRQGVTIFNILIIAVGWFAIFGDGFDIAVIGYVMPNLMREFQLGPETVGLVNSASLAAYPVGALILGWISDHHGRRLGLMIGCLIIGFFTLATVGVHSATGLAFMRFCTGVGLGGVIPNIVALGAEFAPKRLRARLVIFTFCGINFGGFVSGLVAPSIINHWGWQGLFVVGGVVPLIAVVLMWFFMAESIKFLALKGGRDAELRQTLRRLVPDEVIPDNARFVVASAQSKVPFKPRQLFDGDLKWITPILWVAFILNFIVLYFVGAWTNIILQGAGVPPTQAIIVSSLNQGGGVLGGLVISYFVDRYGFLAVMVWGILTASTVWALGVPGLDVGWIATWVVISGFGMQGVQYGLNASTGMLYPTSFRAFAAGWAFSVSRIGAVTGPILGGYLVAQKLTPQQLFFFPVIPLVIGIVLAAVLSVLCYRRFHGLQLDEKAADGVKPAAPALATR